MRARWRWMPGFLLLVLPVAAPAAVDEAMWTLESTLRKCDFVYSETEAGSFVIVFASEAAEGVESWPVTVRLVAGGDWVLVFSTLLRETMGQPFTEDLFLRALAYNSRTAGSKLGLDLESGDLDVQYEIPFAALDPATLRLVILDVAATCDRIHATFQSLTE